MQGFTSEAGGADSPSERARQHAEHARRGRENVRDALEVSVRNDEIHSRARARTVVLISGHIIPSDILREPIPRLLRHECTNVYVFQRKAREYTFLWRYSIAIVIFSFFKFFRDRSRATITTATYMLRTAKSIILSCVKCTCVSIYHL